METVDVEFERIERLRLANIEKVVEHTGKPGPRAEKLGNAMTRKELGEDAYRRHMGRLASRRPGHR